MTIKKEPMAVIAVANQKGGTGKTTTSVTLAHGLALGGHRVLLVDTDVQGHVAAALGLQKAPGMYRMVQWFQGAGNLLVVQARPNLDIVPSDKATEPAKRTLAGLDFRERILSDALAELTNYDVAIIDCAPSVDVLHVSALVAADLLIVPTRLDYLAVDGVNEVLGSLAEIRRRSRAPRLFGILPTFFERQTNETIAQLHALVEAFGSLVLPPIPLDVKLREAPAFGKSIWEYAPTSRSVTGLESSNGGRIGGYDRLVQRLQEVL